MERLTNHDHKEMGSCAYVGEQNPYEVPLTIGELAAPVSDGYSPRAILKEVFGRLAAYEDIGLTPERVAELAQAEKAGRLVVLPCKVGDTIYKVVKCCGKQSGFCFHASCDQSHDQCQYWIATVVEEKVEDVWDMSEVIQHLGETIFLTRQEAEAAVERREEGSNADPAD